MKVGNALRFLAAVFIAAFIFFHWRKQTFNPAASYDGDNPDGKLLGFITDKEGFGAYELGVGGLIVSGLWVGSAIMRHLPIVSRYAPAAQAPK